MPKSIAVIITEKNEDIEVVAPIDIWRRAGIKVQTFSISESNIIQLAHGTNIIPDNNFNLEKISKFSAVYFPGGKGFENYFNFFNNSEFISLLKNEFINNDEKYILAMCAAPKFLAFSGLINGRNYTCYPGFEVEFPETYRNENVISHENLITAKGPGVVFEFAFKVVEEIISKEKAEEISSEMFFSLTNDKIS